MSLKDLSSLTSILGKMERYFPEAEILKFHFRILSKDKNLTLSSVREIRTRSWEDRNFTLSLVFNHILPVVICNIFNEGFYTVIMGNDNNNSRLCCHSHVRLITIHYCVATWSWRLSWVNSYSTILRILWTRPTSLFVFVSQPTIIRLVENRYCSLIIGR